MKKTFGFYAVFWAIFLAIFNVICFVTPGEVAGVSKFTDSFWIGYIFITVSLVGQLFCAFLAFRADSLKKMFNRLSLITVSYTGTVVMLVAGCLCMAIPKLPEWIAIIVCFAVNGFTVFAVLKAAAAAEIVSGIDEKTKEKMQFIKGLTAEAEVLAGHVADAGIKEQCRKVYEAIRYSDPMSSQELNDVELRIRMEFTEFSEAVSAGDSEKCEKLSSSLLALIDERNKKCRLLK